MLPEKMDVVGNILLHTANTLAQNDTQLEDQKKQSRVAKQNADSHKSRQGHPC